jgi:hypothetical protein
LQRAATALARSGDASDIALLGQLLRDRGFLARLDDLKNAATAHLRPVITALGERPTAQKIELCLTLAEDSVFVAEGDRKSLVLELLAAARPMSERTAAVFQRSNAEGYFGFNALLLIDNASPRALTLLESMMLDSSMALEERTELLHKTIVPRRTQLAVVRLADRILTRTRERSLAHAVTESVFDYRQEWFGIESRIAGPPAWDSASTEALRAAVAFADRALARRDVNDRLRAIVGRARLTITRTLSSRGQRGPA